MTMLHDLPNVGAIMEKRLAAVGITKVEALIEMGSKEVFMKLLLHEGDTCLTTLYGLEGAVQGIRWHYLSEEVREELKMFFQTFR